MARRFALLVFLAASLGYGQDLRVDYVRESLTGTHVHYQQYLDGVPVIGGERIDNIGPDGRHTIYENIAHRPFIAMSAAIVAPRAGHLVYLNENGQARLASRVVVEERPNRPYAKYYDAATGVLIRSDALFWSAKQGRVFDPNPVAKLNNPALQDDNGSAAAVPDSAYSIVDLPDLAPSGPLSGPYVQMVDIEPPHPPMADASQSLMFDRSQPQFQEVNAYYHLDRAQRYLQSLGYTGARQLVAYAVPVDAHGAEGSDNSYFISGFTPGRGELVFGDGGTDDAEDSDIMLHEYGHAIQESIAPGVWGGSSSSQSRALAEGSADYWSFSSTYEQTIPSGRDPFCIGDWDARCWNDDPSQFCGYPSGADCLRRIDSSKTMADFINSDAPGTEHQNGEIWSSALREIFMAMTKRYGTDPGKRLADSVVLEGMFGLPANPTYAGFGRNLLAADRALDGGADVDTICSAMVSRSILTPADCVPAPRGEVTWFQSPDHGVSGNPVVSTLTITDPRLIERLDLSVVVTGPPATVNLRAPDGASALFPGSLDAFRGLAAAGVWTLSVQVNASDSPPATLASWSLAIQFEGDQPAASRPLATGSSQTIAAVAHTPGANGTNFVSDVRILNRGTTSAQVTAIFTPTGADGSSSFAAIKLVIAPSQILTLDDVVQNAMHLSGTGQLQFTGDAVQLVVTSRTYTRGATGTFGQSIPAATDAEAIGSGDPAISIPGLENTAAFRSNIGFAEIGGASGEVHVRFYDKQGNDVADETYGIAPFGHVQTNVQPAGEALRAEVTVTGAARVLAYGSVVDNASGDAMFIPAGRDLEGMLPVIHGAGANGTMWRTDVWFANTTAGFRTVLIGWPEGPTGPLGAPPPTIELQPRASVVLRDFLREGFDIPDFKAFPEPDPGVLVTSRTYTTSSDGTFGQFVPPGTPSTAPATLLGIENDAAFRTNIGAMSLAPAVVRFIAYDASGKEIWRSDVFVNGLTQFPLPVPLAIGQVTAAVMAGAGVVPYASVVDNGSGDPIYINVAR